MLEFYNRLRGRPIDWTCMVLPLALCVSCVLAKATNLTLKLPHLRRPIVHYLMKQRRKMPKASLLKGATTTPHCVHADRSSIFFLSCSETTHGRVDDGRMACA